MTIRLISAADAQALSREEGERPCESSLQFPGDEVAAVCGLKRKHTFHSWHENAEGTRRWGYDDGTGGVEGMAKPGSPPLLTSKVGTTRIEELSADRAQVSR